MANEEPVATPAAPAAPVTAPEPVAATPAPAAETPATAPVEATKPAEAPKVDTAPEEPQPHTETPTLMEEAKAEGEAKKDDAGKSAESPKAETKDDEQQPRPDGSKPKVQPFEFKAYNVPENVKLDEGRFGELNTILNTDYLSPQDQGQALMDLHVGEMTRYADNLAKEQHRVFGETRAQWRKELKGDEELGGSGYQTTLQAGARMRDQFVSSAKPGTEKYIADMKQFNDFMRITGAGDHPAFWRILNNVARKFDEPAAPRVPYQPPPDIGKKPGARGRRSTIYDHPTSHSNRS